MTCHSSSIISGNEIQNRLDGVALSFYTQIKQLFLLTAQDKKYQTYSSEKNIYLNESQMIIL